jgi:aspartyl/asparaginyl beta-hydroxylase (cupin superfamily)
LNPEIEHGLAQIQARHGKESLRRIEQMLIAGPQERHPLQRQSQWIMPGLSTKPWHNPHEYESLLPVVRALEAAHPQIKAEIHGAFQSMTAIEDYKHPVGAGKAWQALYVFRGGRPVEDNRTLVPSVFRVAEEAIGDRLFSFGEIHFSILQPGAAIKPHCDVCNFSINLHLAVDIPPGCTLRVANVDHFWEEGKCLLFDYSYLHEAWNRSDRPRICLLVDLWNPHVTLAEREALVFLLKQVRKLQAETKTRTSY